MIVRLLVVFYFLHVGAWAAWDSLQIRVGAAQSAAGIWVPKGKLPKQLPVLIWLHGGMQSGKCEKGFEAGLAALPWLSQKTVLVASPSACRDKHWLSPAGLDAMESLLDSLDARFSIDPSQITLIGVSDGGFGVTNYSLQGKRKIAHRVLMSTYPGAWIPTDQIKDVKQKLSTGTWTFLQGGADRMFPAEQTKPWIEAFCNQVPHCTLQWDSQGEHDMSWWVEHRPEWIQKSFANFAPGRVSKNRRKQVMSDE